MWAVVCVFAFVRCKPNQPAYQVDFYGTTFEEEMMSFLKIKPIDRTLRSHALNCDAKPALVLAAVHLMECISALMTKALKLAAAPFGSQRRAISGVIQSASA